MKVISIAIGLLFLGLGIPMVSGKAENRYKKAVQNIRHIFDFCCNIYGTFRILL